MENRDHQIIGYYVCMLYFCAAKYNIQVIITHIAGVNNAIADALSHFQVTISDNLPHMQYLCRMSYLHYHP